MEVKVGATGIERLWNESLLWRGLENLRTRRYAMIKKAELFERSEFCAFLIGYGGETRS